MSALSSMEFAPFVGIPKELALASTAVVCEQADIHGKVTIGPDTVVHPKARIIAAGGPIVIGSGNQICEMAVLFNRPKADGESHTMVIGNNNYFDVFARCESNSVGDGNTFEAKCYVGENVSITNNCFISSLVSLKQQETIPSNMVIYSDHGLRRTFVDPPPVPYIPTEFMAQFLPKNQKLVKTNAPLN